MTDQPTTCSCPPGRPLTMGHQPDCPLGEALATPSNVVGIYRGPDGRAVAVPGEVVYEAEREYRAYLVFQRTGSWQRTAEAEGYPDANAAQAAVKRYLDEGRAVVGELSRTEMAAVELTVLRAYREALWDAAMAGKAPAVMASLSVHDRIVRLLALDVPEEGESDLSGRTVVVPSEDYIQELRAVSGAS